MCCILFLTYHRRHVQVTGCLAWPDLGLKSKSTHSVMCPSDLKKCCTFVRYINTNTHRCAHRRPLSELNCNCQSWLACLQWAKCSWPCCYFISVAFPPPLHSSRLQPRFLSLVFMNSDILQDPLSSHFLYILLSLLIIISVTHSSSLPLFPPLARSLSRLISAQVLVLPLVTFLFPLSPFLLSLFFL